MIFPIGHGGNAQAVLCHAFELELLSYVLPCPSDGFYRSATPDEQIPIFMAHAYFSLDLHQAFTKLVAYRCDAILFFLDQVARNFDNANIQIYHRPGQNFRISGTHPGFPLNDNMPFDFRSVGIQRRQDGEHGKILKWYGSSVDIEDYKRAEEQLRRSAEELQRSESYLAEGQRLAHMGSWAFDAAGFDYWSPELFRIHGLDPANKAPTVQEYLDCVHPQDRESMANLIKGILAEASCFDATKRIVRPDGEVRYIRCVGAPVIENQRLKKYVGSAIDITEQELMKQELHSREVYLTEAQRLSYTGSFGWKPASGEIVWSDETYRIFSRTARKPSLLPGSGLLPLAAHEPVMAGSADRDPGYVCRDHGWHERRPHTSGAADVCDGSSRRRGLGANFCEVAAAGVGA